MNTYAIQHTPDSHFAYALDEHTLRLVLWVAKGEKIKSIEVLWTNNYEFPRHRSCTRMQKRGSSDLYDYYFADISSVDVRFAYIFYIQTPDEDEFYFFSEAGLTREYDFPTSYFTFFQFPYIQPCDITRVIPWTRDAVFYQIFPDRFRRGDFDKDDRYITQEWNEVSQSKSFAGGDLKGITEKLGYLADMGITALYLTPVFKSPSNHKYNITDYLEVDPMFGTNEDLHELIDATHARGMKLVIDTVFNHCDESCPKFQDVLQKGRASKYYDWFVIHGDVPEKYTHSTCNYEIFADCAYMPKWNTSNPAVRKFFVNIALSYLEWGFDGLRLDVADEVSHTLWQELRAAVKEKFPEALIIGELWHENGMYLRGNEFDSVMNYKLQKAFTEYFAAGSIDAKTFAEWFNRNWYRNKRQVNEMMLNFLDNHDTPRFLRLCAEDKERLLEALVALYFCEGMPCVFYGTELPLTGDGDPDCRRTYDWSQTAELYDLLKSLVRMRKELPHGDMYAYEEGGSLVLVRENQEERAKAYFGNADAAQGTVIYHYGTVQIVRERK